MRRKGSVIGTNTVPIALVERPNWDAAIVGNKTNQLLGDVLGLIVLAQQPDVVMHDLARRAAARTGSVSVRANEPLGTDNGIGRKYGHLSGRGCQH